MIKNTELTKEEFLKKLQEYEDIESVFIKSDNEYEDIESVFIKSDNEKILEKIDKVIDLLKMKKQPMIYVPYPVYIEQHVPWYEFYQDPIEVSSPYPKEFETQYYYNPWISGTSLDAMRYVDTVLC